jgi:hypothetical protein
MKRFVQAAGVAGAVILSAAGCCSSCGSKHAAAAAPCASGQCAAAKPATPTTSSTSTYGVAGRPAPQMIPTTVQTGNASITGDAPANYKMPGS